MNGLLPGNLFRYQDFQKATRLERIYMHLVDSSRYPLRDMESRYLSMLQRAFTVICENPNKRECRRIITDLLEGENVTDPRPGNRNNVSTYKVISDAQELFGRFEVINKRVERGLMRERISVRLQKLYTLVNNAEPGKEVSPDIDRNIHKYEELLMKLDKLNEIIDEDGMNLELPELNFSTNPAALFEEAQVEPDTHAEEE